MNFLEQLVAEWYEYRGFLVRRNINVGPRPKGGHEGELDVVAFSPEEKRLVHIETSMDQLNWEQKEARFKKKFEIGKTHIPPLFAVFGTHLPIEQIALLGGSGQAHSTIGDAKVQTVCDLLREIRRGIPHDVKSHAVPEQYVILRTLQFAVACWNKNSN